MRFAYKLIDRFADFAFLQRSILEEHFSALIIAKW